MVGELLMRVTFGEFSLDLDSRQLLGRIEIGLPATALVGEIEVIPDSATTAQLSGFYFWDVSVPLEISTFRTNSCAVTPFAAERWDDQRTSSTPSVSPVS